MLSFFWVDKCRSRIGGIGRHKAKTFLWVSKVCYSAAPTCIFAKVWMMTSAKKGEEKKWKNIRSGEKFAACETQLINGFIEYNVVGRTNCGKFGGSSCLCWNLISFASALSALRWHDCRHCRLIGWIELWKNYGVSLMMFSGFIVCRCATETGGDTWA